MGALDPVGAYRPFPLRKLSPLPRPQRDEDVFVPSLQSAPEAMVKPKRDLALGLLMAGSAAAAVAGSPSAAVAIDGARPAPSKEELKAQGLQLILRSQGQAIPLSEGLQRLKPEARRELEKLPPSLQKVFVNLDSEALRWLQERVNGTTWVAVIPINNREALISGRALGQDVYERALNGLKRQVERGAIPAELEGRLRDLLLQLKQLSPEQRATLVHALEAQLN